MVQKPVTSYLTGALIAATVGGIMLVASDFAGWYYRVPYGEVMVDRYGAVGLFSPYFVVFAAFAVFLFYAAYVSYQGLRTGGDSVPRAALERAYRGTAAVFAGCVLGAVVFVVLVVLQDTEDWWLDAGFYGGAVGSGLTALFLRMATRNS